MSFRRAARVDGNQPELVRKIRKLGFSVHIVSQLKNFCDIIVGGQGKNWLFEIKDPGQPAGSRELTEGEAEFHKGWKGQVDIIETIDDFIKIINHKQQGCTC